MLRVLIIAAILTVFIVKNRLTLKYGLVRCSDVTFGAGNIVNLLTGHTTYRDGVSEGTAARAFYKRMGFTEGKLIEEFGSPAQEFVLKRICIYGG